MRGKKLKVKEILKKTFNGGYINGCNIIVINRNAL